MPASDYDARALALPLEDDETGETAIWSRRITSASFRRNPPVNRLSWQQRILHNYDKLSRRVLEQYKKLSRVQKVLLFSASIVVGVLGLLFMIYNERIFSALLPVAKSWRNVTAGWLILWACIFIAAIPPLIGHSTLLTVAGFVYGFPNGWFIAATATVAGSTASFILSRSVLNKMVHRLLENDTRFAALALTLKHDGLKLLIMIRLCPLPYSLSNGAVATFPTVHWASFAAATALVTPKFMLHIFVGAQLEKIAESGGRMDARTKAMSYASIAIGAIAGVITGWFMYKKTKQRAAQLEAEERADTRRTSIEGLGSEYADDPGALEAASRIRPERIREESDDISLQTSWEDDFGEDAYRDEPDIQDAVEIEHDPFKDGDGDTEEEEDSRGK